MSEDTNAIDQGEEVNEYMAIENFVTSVLPNNSLPSEGDVETINALSTYDKQAMRSNIILSMANLIEMVTYLDHPDEEIELDTIASIDIMTMEIFAEMVRYAFVLNGADAKLFCARVLSGFDYNENNPPASSDNTAVRYLEEALAYFIQEDEDDVKTFLRSLQVLNHGRPDCVAIKWIGGQMFDKEGGNCLDYNDFVELVVVPYEQKLPEREAARACAAGMDFGADSQLDPGEEGHHPVQKLFVEQLDELLAQGREVGNTVESALDVIDADLKARLQAGMKRAASVAADNEPVIAVVPNDTLSPEEVALSSDDFTTRGEPIADTMEMAFKPVEFEGNRRERDIIGFGAAYRAKVGEAFLDDLNTRIPPSLLKKE